MKGRFADWSDRARHASRRGVRWVVRHVPPGVRTLVGIGLILGGVFGFLPVLGFWMIPLGVAVLLMDCALLRRWWRGRPIRWRRPKGERRP